MMMSKEQIQNELMGLTARQLGWYSKAFFARNYLDLIVPDHQKAWYDCLDRRRHLQLAPRDHGKTTVFCHAFPTWKICYVPDIRILLVSKTSGQAYKNMDVVRRELKKNEQIREDFGELIEKDSGAIWCKRTEQGRKLKDPTLEAVGAEGAITGGHFDVIICDDIIDDENTKTAGRMQSLENWFYGTIGQLAEPHTQIIVIGTRKHYADLYQQLLDNAIWQTRIDRAILKYPDEYKYIYNDSGNIVDVEVHGEHEVLWPKEWDIKSLLLDRYQTGSIMFDREKQNDPSGMKGQFLDSEWLHYYDELPPKEELVFYVGVDLAISEEEHADETVFCLGAKHTLSAKVYLIEFVHGRWDFPTQQKKLIDAYERWTEAGMRPREVVVESNVYQAAFAQQLARDTWLPVVEVKTMKDKTTKLLGLAPYFENKSVLLSKNGMGDFIQQWTQFPFGEHDDHLDAMEKMVNRIMGEGQSGVLLMDADSADAGEEDEYWFCPECSAEYGKENYPDDKKCTECGAVIV